MLELSGDYASGVTDGSAATARVRRLNATELESYDVLPPELAARVRIIRVPFLIGRYQGAVLGRNVFLRMVVPADGDSRLIAHELVHVRQWSELGIVGFSYRYVSQFLRGLVRTRRWQDAYQQIEVEEEARQIADDWHGRRNTSPPTET